MRREATFGLILALVSANAGAGQAVTVGQESDTAELTKLVELKHCHLIGRLLGKTDEQPLDTPRCQYLSAMISKIEASSPENPSRTAENPSDAVASTEHIAQATTASRKKPIARTTDEPTTSLQDIQTPPVLVGRSTYAQGGAVQVSATSQNSQAGIDLKTEIKAGAAGDSSTYLTSSFVAPISKTTPSTTNVATLDGLANAFKFTFGLQRITLHRRSPIKDDGDYVSGYEETCNELGLAVDNNCQLSGPITPSQYKALLPYYIDTKHPGKFYGATASVGYESGNFYNQLSLAKTSNSDEPWEVGGYYGLFYPLSNAVYQVGISVQHAYKVLDIKTLCPTPKGVSPTTCDTGSFGRPAMTVKQLAYLELRHQFEGLPVAIDAKFTHDFKTHDNGLDVPIFFISDTKHGLTGGIRLGWTNTDHASAGVFVGTPFSLLPSQ